MSPKRLQSACKKRGPRLSTSPRPWPDRAHGNHDSQTRDAEGQRSDGEDANISLPENRRDLANLSAHHKLKSGDALDCSADGLEPTQVRIGGEAA